MIVKTVEELEKENEMYKEKEKKIRDILFKTNIWNEDMVKIFRVIEEDEKIND